MHATATAERMPYRSELFEVCLDVGGRRRRRQTAHEHLLGPCHQLSTVTQSPGDTHD